MTAVAQKEKLNVVCIQMTSTNSIDSNETEIIKALELIESEFRSADLVVFPENVWYFRLNSHDQLPDFKTKLSQNLNSYIEKWCQKTKVAVVFGAVPLRIDKNAKPESAMVVFEPDKPYRKIYSKVHLFDVDVAGVQPVRESDHLSAGLVPSIWDFKGWKFGCAICYDVRFAELFSEYAKTNVDVILLPSAFLVPTGRQHWEILTRARAIESQAYLLAPAQSGEHQDSESLVSRKTYGRSLIVDPWGRVLASASTEKSGLEIISATLDLAERKRVMDQIPMESHRRLGVFRGEKK